MDAREPALAGKRTACELTGIEFDRRHDGAVPVVADQHLVVTIHEALAYAGPAAVAEVERAHVAHALSGDLWGDLGILRWKVGQARALMQAARTSTAEPSPTG